MKVAVLALIIVLMAVMMIGVFQAVKENTKLIMEEGTEAIIDQYGEAICYRYYIDGIESFTIIRNQDQLEAFRAYLRKIGKFVEKTY